MQVTSQDLEVVASDARDRNPPTADAGLFRPALCR
jgi:hypothetical protein